MKNKKIIRIIARLNVGGPAKHVAWVCSELDKRGYKNLLVHGIVGEDEDDMEKFSREKSVKLKKLPCLGREIHLLKDFFCGIRIFFVLVGTKPEILHTHTAKAGFLGRLAGIVYKLFFPFRKLKIVHTFHGHTFHGYFSPAKEKLFLFLERFLAFFTDTIITISKRQQDEILHTYKVGTLKKHRLVPLGIDPSFADHLDLSLRKVFAARDKKVVGIVGRIAPIKDHLLFIQTVYEFNRILPDECLFVIVGSGDLKLVGSLQDKAKELEIYNLVFAGNIDEAEKIYGLIDILVLTSLNEGTPVSILEAFSSRKPVVSVSVGGVADLLGENRERGILIQNRDPVKIAAGIQKALQADATMIENAYTFVHENYSVSRLVSDLEKIYERA